MTIQEWIAYGVSRGYCLEAFCGQHNDLLTPAEFEQFEAGEDPCAYVLRLLEDRSDA